jgi:eukaryotic-like serine/threonine-protein kinase
MGQAVDSLGLVGTTIEQVRFDACVDSGGFGLVYRGQHLGLGEEVAIKCLRMSHAIRGDETLRETIANRFRDETRLLYRLSQGNLDIVRCISSGTIHSPATGELTPYMVLEWLDGCTLSTDLRDRRDHMLPPRTLEETIALLDSAANALAYAHAQGVVHRDVKPGNLFLTKTREGVRMKVLDFGLAKILSDENLGVRPTAQTAMGVHFCSPSYGAPEQFTPQVGPIGPWTDIYSLTLVILEVLKGAKVRPASTLADGVLKALDPAQGSPRASALGLTLPPAVEDLLHRAVAQKPLERPRDAGVFWSALRELVKRASIPPPKMEPPLQSTAYDANVAAAMEQVRAAQAAAPAAAAANQPSPFAGTMMMPNAPMGAPHMPPGHHVGVKIPAVIIQEPEPSLMQTQAPATAPLALPMTARSPLAASLGPGKHQQPGPPPPSIIHPPTPSAQQPPLSTLPLRPTPVAPNALHDPTQQSGSHHRMTTSIPPPPPTNAGARIAIAIIVFLFVLVGGGATIWWFMLRGKTP